MHRFKFLIQIALTTCLFIVAKQSEATRPLMDFIVYEGKDSIVTTDSGWLNFPENEKIRQIRLSQRCSAIGGPRGKWRISEDRLYLTGLYICGGDLGLDTMYGETAGPIFANWMTADLHISAGKVLCQNGFDQALHEKTLTLQIIEGQLKKVTESSNMNHPAVPTVADVKKFFNDTNDKEHADRAAEIVSSGTFHCLTPELQKKLREPSTLTQ